MPDSEVALGYRPCAAKFPRIFSWTSMMTSHVLMLSQAGLSDPEHGYDSFSLPPIL